MKKRKYLMGAFLLLIFALGLAYYFKPMTLNDIYDKPNFKGTVMQVSEGAILVEVDPEEDEIKSSDLISVSLEVQLKDSMTHFEPGDRVGVYYNGEIAESYPAQIHTVYAILLVESRNVEP